MTWLRSFGGYRCATVERRKSEHVIGDRKCRWKSLGGRTEQFEVRQRQHQPVANNTRGLVAATAVKSNSSVTCSGSTASVSGNAQLVGLTVAGQSILVSNPNLSISLPGGISVIINQQTSSSGGSSGSMTVNALHVTGRAIDIVVGSAQSGITCS